MVEITAKTRAKRGSYIHHKGMHPNSLKNLHPFQKGNHASPGRPPKDVCLTSLLKEELDKICPNDKHGRTWRQLLVFAWLTGALKNPALLKELLERTEGKVIEPVDVTSKGERINDGADIRTFIAGRISSIAARSGTPGDTIQPN